MTYNFPIAFMDNKLLDMTVTPIPDSGSLPLQVIADSGFKSAVRVDFIDTSGDFIGVYLGVAASETLLCIIGGGVGCGWAFGVFAAHSRVSLRSMTTTPITAGKLTLTLMSY